MSAAENEVASALAATENSPKSLGQIIDRMKVVRDERRLIGARDKVLVEEFDQLEAQLITRMKAEGMESTSSPLATATKTVNEIPVVEDWDAFYAYMRDSDSLHLLQRRAAIGAMTELKNASVAIPGVRWIEKEEISLRAK